MGNSLNEKEILTQKRQEVVDKIKLPFPLVYEHFWKTNKEFVETIDLQTLESIVQSISEDPRLNVENYLDTVVKQNPKFVGLVFTDKLKCSVEVDYQEYLVLKKLLDKIRENISQIDEKINNIEDKTSKFFKEDEKE